MLLQLNTEADLEIAQQIYISFSLFNLNQLLFTPVLCDVGDVLDNVIQLIENNWIEEIMYRIKPNLPTSFSNVIVLLLPPQNALSSPKVFRSFYTHRSISFIQ